MVVDNDHPAIECFRDLSEGVIEDQLANEELSTQVTDLKKFAFQVYCKAGPRTLPAPQWDLFCSRDLEGEMLPPARVSVLPHITRANFRAMCDILLPLKRLDGANTKEQTFPLWACLSLHPKLLLGLPNRAASQTARDTVACSRTEIHVLLFAMFWKNTAKIHLQMTHELMTRKKKMML